MIKPLVLTGLFILISTMIIRGQDIPIPRNYIVIDTVSGDLDNDHIKELVVAYDTKVAEYENENVQREIRIYKIKNGAWEAWKTSEQALHKSRDGGMMNDPYGDIEIRNGILLISQSGGSSWKWNITDKYRYQDGEFYLIGYTSNYGKLCEYWLSVDFNLSTGKMIVVKEYENCENSEQEIYKRENEILIKKGIKITFQNRNENIIKIVTSKYKHEIYI